MASWIDQIPPTVITQNNKPVIYGGSRVIPRRRRGLGKKNPIRIAQESEKGMQLALRSPQKVQVATDGKTIVSGRRAYKEVSAIGGVNSDWALNALTEDSDIWQNIFALRQRSRDLFRTDVYFKKYAQELFANVFGYSGYSMRLLIKETEDRIVYSNAEKSYWQEHQMRHRRVGEYLSRKLGHKSDLESRFSDFDWNRQSATVRVGDFDLYAIKVIMDAFKEWQRREYCTMAGRLDYNEVRQTRLLSAARDGDFFIRHYEGKNVNKFGYSMQLINSEWCDFYLNTALRNGNEIRMGIERDKYGRPLNYYFIKRRPMDWQYAIPGAFNYSTAEGHEIVPADEIIHYAKYEDGDSTRPAPWSAAVIPKSRHLDKYEEAEVVAARVNAMKMGFFYSDLVPEGGMNIGEEPDPTKANTLEAEPGSFQGLPWGIKFQDWDPKHPNQNFDLFRKGILRAWCAGLPGANYNIIANDLEGVNYSSGRLGMLDERELWKQLQQFDISIAEIPIFERWLRNALTFGAIPLPLSKFDKFNQPCIRGRRWAWVDPFKEVQASAMQVANRFTSRTRVIEDSDSDADFKEILFEQAEEEMLMEELGIDPTPVVGRVAPAKPAEDTSSDEGLGDTGDETKSLSFIEVVKLFKNEPQQVTIGSPILNVPAPQVNIGEIKLPEQKPPVVNIAPAKIIMPETKMPAIKSPDVVVNVAPADVHVHNDIKVPSTKAIKIERDKEGKMSGASVEKE